MKNCVNYNIIGEPLEDCMIYWRSTSQEDSFYDFLEQAEGCCDGFVVAIDPYTELCKPDHEDFRIFVNTHLEEFCGHESIRD